MKTEDLLIYLEGVFNTELDIYTQKKLLEKLTAQHKNLSKRKKIYPPEKRKPDISLLFTMFCSGTVTGIIVGIISIIEAIKSLDSIWRLIPGILAVVLCAAIGFIAGAIIIGSILWLIIYIYQSNQASKDHTKAVAAYNTRIKEQEKQLSIEKNQKNALYNEICYLRNYLHKSENNLKIMYSYNILSPEYKNIYAVSSILSYLKNGRTHCLSFDPTTGDQGAYNIYEAESRLDRIITNTDEILLCLDRIENYQQELTTGLLNATEKINSLASGINKSLSKISASVSSVEQSQKVLEYNSKCANAQLAMLTWLNTYY